ncbi:sulfotransferase [Draconibacterium sp. IB214405]|uniref:sulfotransferase n=1 Tax=Draconibacterium sp. IB214405 TaxID=3097352 RepID=UPI002A0D7747|nr:sulfotransferase [Draconibacterium sp. IB214405]MDX8338266.1 sulfotransferase [Draconibacterium sp. IB214405]
MMIFYAVLFIGFFLIAIILRYYRNLFYAIAEGSLSVVNQLLSDEAEEQKVVEVQHHTNKLLVVLLKLILLLVVAIGIGSVPVFIYSFFADQNLKELEFFTFYPILAISLGATLAFFIPLGAQNKNGYSELSRLLHRMALNNYYLENRLFKYELRKNRSKKTKPKELFIVVSGLARAGTTSLMNDLAKIDEFVTLGYANMPFLLAPNLWKKLYKPKNEATKERSHNDGIMIGLNSNEALEEYFFKVKAKDSYIDDNCLSEYEITPEDYNDYLDYQSLIKQDDPKTYLAKNNNFLLRYKSVRKFNNDFLMVILFRHPLTHAMSLLEKHRDYKKLQNDDPFVLEYMNWLGHHEFGLNQKAFKFSASPEFDDPDKDNLDYWLQSWINYYSYVLTIRHENTLVINYEHYCSDPKNTIGRILAKAGISAPVPDYPSFVNNRKGTENYSEVLLQTAEQIYQQLNDSTPF